MTRQAFTAVACLGLAVVAATAALTTTGIPSGAWAVTTLGLLTGAALTLPGKNTA